MSACRHEHHTATLTSEPRAARRRRECCSPQVRRCEARRRIAGGTLTPPFTRTDGSPWVTPHQVVGHSISCWPTPDLKSCSSRGRLTSILEMASTSPLSAREDLIVTKLLADRPKDIDDVRGILQERLSIKGVADEAAAYRASCSTPPRPLPTRPARRGIHRHWHREGERRRDAGAGVMAVLHIGRPRPLGLRAGAFRTPLASSCNGERRSAAYLRSAAGRARALRRLDDRPTPAR